MNASQLYGGVPFHFLLADNYLPLSMQLIQLHKLEHLLFFSIKIDCVTILFGKILITIEANILANINAD